VPDDHRSEYLLIRAWHRSSPAPPPPAGGTPTTAGAQRPLNDTLLLHGLDHVDDPDQVMFPTVSAASPSAAPPAT